MGILDFLFGSSEAKDETAAVGTTKTSADYPSRLELYKATFDEYDPATASFASFWNDETSHQVQIVLSPESADLNFDYPHDDEAPLEFLKGKGVALPADFTVIECEPGTFVCVGGSRPAADDLAALIDQVFLKYFGEETGFVVSACIE